MKLNNGIEMPNVGLGTFLLSPADAERSVDTALKAGYKLIDTANAYVNERAVGRGIKSSGVARDEIFVSTKLWPSEYENENAVEETLERLGLDHIDLLFLHQPAGNWKKGYKMLEKAYATGKIRSIGISNFEGKYLDELLQICNVLPQVMQVECHPYYPQTELRRITDIHDIRIMSWYPLGGKGNKQSLLGEKPVQEIAQKYNKSPAQIILRWHTQMGFIVIPGSKNPEHIKDNINIFDFTLTQEDMNHMAELNKNTRYYYRKDEDLNRWANWRPQFEEK